MERCACRRVMKRERARTRVPCWMWWLQLPKTHPNDFLVSHLSAMSLCTVCLASLPRTPAWMATAARSSDRLHIMGGPRPATLCIFCRAGWCESL